MTSVCVTADGQHVVTGSRDEIARNLAAVSVALYQLGMYAKVLHLGATWPGLGSISFSTFVTC